jgi:hypothetical protein
LRRREVGQPDREAGGGAGVELAEGLGAVAVSIGVHVGGAKVADRAQRVDDRVEGVLEGRASGPIAQGPQTSS